MSYRLVFVLNAVVALALGAMFVVFPVPSLAYFRMGQIASTVLTARFFGSAMVALGALLWVVKDSDDPNLRGRVGIVLLAGSILGLVVNVIGLANGVMVVNGWIPLIIYVLFGLAYAFLIFLKPKMKE